MSKSKLISNENSTSSKNKVYSTGKRKTSIARIWVSYGKGNLIVNKIPISKCFQERQISHINNLLKNIDSLGKFDIWCTVKGGGLTGQAEAITHGIAKAINILNPELHKQLRQLGYLTRDSRIVERKKYGRHKARKSTQYSKR